MHNESYSLILNSQTSTNIINNTNLSSVKYNVNWLNILPQKYRRYNVKFSFASDNANTVGMVGPLTNGVQTVNGVHYGGPIFVGMKYFNNGDIYTITSFGTGTGFAGTYNIDKNVTFANNLLFSTNTLFNSNVICSINFGSNNTIENNTSSNKIGTLYPYTYLVRNPELHTSNLSCSINDNEPIEILYPSNNNITVSLTNIDGTPVRMTNYNLQLYFEPIIEDINENIQNNLLSGSY
jgi:hypothetical protein